LYPSTLKIPKNLELQTKGLARAQHKLTVHIDPLLRTNGLQVKIPFNPNLSNYSMKSELMEYTLLVIRFTLLVIRFIG
jgi:hypothetical protein